MFKYLCKKNFLLRFLVIVLSVIVVIEFVVSYNRQIAGVFKNVNSQYYSGFVNDGSIKQVSQIDIGDLFNITAYNGSVTEMVDLLAKIPCPKTVQSLFGNLTNFTTKLNKTLLEIDQLEEILSERLSLRVGGQWSPSDCEPEYKIAIIIPYRDRVENLKLFLLNMHPFFVNQKISYGIYLIEPLKYLPFNRGLLMNVGYLEALKDSYYLWNCFFFHDVDMLAEDVRNLYSCDKKIPKHYAVAVSKWNYRTNGYFSKYYGGINAYTREQYNQINGFSNVYFGWGGEDDDLRERTVAVFKKFTKESADVHRYFMNAHIHQKVNPNRSQVLQKGTSEYKRGEIKEGVSNVKYTVKKVEKNLLFTRILIDHPSKPFL